MAANDGAFASFVQKWLAANPEQVAVGVFLAPEARLRASGFGALVHELAETAFATREPQVAAAKLAWWRQDLAADEPRHPIAKTLMADAQAAAIDPALWSALVDGALAELDAPPPADLAAAFAVLNAFYGPVAALETALAGGDPAENAAISHLWICSHLLGAAGAPGLERAPLPLDLLARHGLTRAELAGSGQRRTAVLGDLSRELAAEIERNLARASRASVGRRVRARLDLGRARRAAKGADAAAVLAGSRSDPWRSVWLAWQEARRSRPRAP
ncbi:MAG TPA: squalene/phytoene synthase family protein [Rudaea sp.]|nr:squalene/phytoene synthase family protein [Rudaea sp.]